MGLSRSFYFILFSGFFLVLMSISVGLLGMGNPPDYDVVSVGIGMGELICIVALVLELELREKGKVG